MAWESAFLPYQKKPPSFEQFVGGVDAKLTREPAEFLNMRLRQASRGLTTITMAQHLASVRRR